MIETEMADSLAIFGSTARGDGDRENVNQRRDRLRDPEPMPNEAPDPLEKSNLVYHEAQDRMALLPNYYAWIHSHFADSGFTVEPIGLEKVPRLVSGVHSAGCDGVLSAGPKCHNEMGR